jgi:hypothetical protein
MGHRPAHAGRGEVEGDGCAIGQKERVREKRPSGTFSISLPLSIFLISY